MRNQGGSVVINLLLVLVMMGIVLAVYLTSQKASKPSGVAEANKARLSSLSSHLRQIEETVRINREHLQNEINGNRKSISDLAQPIIDAEESSEINQLQDHLARIRKEIHRIQNETPKEIKVVHKNAEFIKAGADVEVRGYEWMTTRKGKPVKAVKYWTVPTKKTKSIKRIELPGAKESKRRLVEAGL